MAATHGIRLGVGIGVVLIAAMFASTAVSAAGGAGTEIFQQRTPDGRIVFTDRPVSGAVTQRQWTPPVEDALAARQRREDARRDAEAVSERIQRSIEADRQREQELRLAQMQLAAAQAVRDAEAARAAAAAAENDVVFIVPARHWRPPVHRPPIKPGPPRPRVPAGGKGLGVPQV
jgi:hypothetical protein